MLVRFTHSGQVVADLQASVTWSATATRDLGQASITVPRTSPAWDAAYVDEQGGFLVELYTQSGSWKGVADRPVFSAEGATVAVFPLAVWLEGRLLPHARTFRCVTAGAIAQRAVLDGLAGLGSAALLPGTFCEAGPHVPSYAFTGQSVLQVLTDLHDRTGQEWHIDGAGRVSWVPRQGSYRERHLIDDGVFFGPWQYAGASLRDVAHDVVETDGNGIVYVAVANTVPPLWPRQQKG